jgi:hypothetical protein
VLSVSAEDIGVPGGVHVGTVRVCRPPLIYAARQPDILVSG